VLPQEDGEQGVGAAEGDALGLGGCGILGLTVAVDDDRLWPRGAGVGQLGLDRSEAALQVGATLLQEVAVEGGDHGVGLTVESLAGTVAVTGEAGDSAVGFEEDGRGAGEAVRQG
jgi:hypothetical protein